MKRILSLDWDYFINATEFQRGMLFPDGGDESISYELQDLLWDYHYRSISGEELLSLGVIDDFFPVLNILNNFVLQYLHTSENDLKKEVLVTISHRWIYDFIMQRTSVGEEFEVYNVDFHHDMYNFRVKHERVNCGNWVNCLLEDRPKMKYHWVKREDSDILTTGDEPVFCTMLDLKDLKDLDFDYVFICRSDCWSPPHLDARFSALWNTIRNHMPVEIEKRAMDCRKLSDASQERIKQMLLLQSRTTEW